MSFLVGRAGKARETYPGGGGPNQALVALANRYLISPTSPGTPAPFEGSNASPEPVAYANVTRRASGLFVVGVQVPVTLAGADTLLASAILLSGSSSGGAANGQWSIETAGHAITVPVTPSFASPVSAFEDQRGAGNLAATITLNGANASPLPVGVAGTLVIFGATASGAVVVTPTSGGFFAYAFELP
jgi:hypothetical protein